MAFRAKLRHRWRSWLAIAILISIVGGLVVAAAAAGRRTQAAFPQFVAAHGFDADVYTRQPVAKVAKLPGVTSATEVISPDTGQPTCRCTHPINPTELGVIFVPNTGRSPYKLISGRLPDPSAPDQVLASFTLQAGRRGTSRERDPRAVLRVVTGTGLQQRRRPTTETQGSDHRPPCRRDSKPPNSSFPPGQPLPTTSTPPRHLPARSFHGHLPAMCTWSICVAVRLLSPDSTLPPLRCRVKARRVGQTRIRLLFRLKPPSTRRPSGGGSWLDSPLSSDWRW